MVNYSFFATKTNEQIYKEAAKRGITVANGRKYLPREDLIGLIIDHDAYYQGRDDAINGRSRNGKVKPISPSMQERHNYMFINDGIPYFLSLTNSQRDLLIHLMKNGVINSKELYRTNETKFNAP